MKYYGHLQKLLQLSTMLLLLCAAEETPLWSLEELPLYPGEETVSLRDYISALSDEDEEFSAADIADRKDLFLPLPEGTPDFGLNRSPRWLSFSIRNKGWDENWILDFGIHKFFTLELYRESAPGRYILEQEYSYRDGFRAREIAEARLALPLRLRSGSRENFLMKISSENGLTLPLKLHSREGFLISSGRWKIILAVINAVSAVMALYHIMIWLMIRDRNYLYYVLYVLLNILYLSALSGLGAQYLWPDIQGRWTTIFSSLFGGITMALGLQLAREFLGSDSLCRRTHIYINCLIGLSLFLALSNIFIPTFMVCYLFGNILGVLNMVTIMTLSLIHSLRGNKPARLFLFSYLVIIAGQLGYSLRAIDLFRGMEFLLDINQYTPALQLILLSLALSYRISVIQKEREEAREAALRAETILAEELEKRVNERTLELRIANDRLRELSDLDGLTGLYNRRFFDESLDAEWKRRQRSGLPLALIFCDIDHFKKYNDAAGHLAGDDCIRKIAGLLKQSARREGDVAARYGGEEFAVILPRTSAGEAERIAESIQKGIRELDIPHPAFTETLVTMSFGIAVLEAGDGAAGADLIDAADMALYDSKRSGRNRITVSERAEKNADPARFGSALS